MHPLIIALEIKKLPVGLSENELVEKILNDSFLNRRAMYHMVSQFAETAIKQMHPIERAGFVKRLGCGPAVVQKVSWAVCQAPNSGLWMITGKVFGEDISFTGPPENAPLLKFRGETVPRHVVEEYSQRYVAMGFEQDAQQHGHFQQREK
jgi:hypothetical protein